MWPSSVTVPCGSLRVTRAQVLLVEIRSASRVPPSSRLSPQRAPTRLFVSVKTPGRFHFVSQRIMQRKGNESLLIGTHHTQSLNIYTRLCLHPEGTWPLVPHGKHIWLGWLLGGAQLCPSLCPQSARNGDRGCRPACGRPRLLLLLHEAKGLVSGRPPTSPAPRPQPASLPLTPVFVSRGCCSKRPRTWWLRVVRMQQNAGSSTSRRGPGCAPRPSVSLPAPSGWLPSVACGHVPLVSASVVTWPPAPLSLLLVSLF